MGPCAVRHCAPGRDDEQNVLVSSSVSNNTLQNLHGTLALAGAGKMGGAMLTGWLAGGLDPERVVVVEPHPVRRDDSAGGARQSGSIPPHTKPARSTRWWSR